MCGRYSLYDYNMTPEEFENRFGFPMPDTSDFPPSYNISPYSKIPVIYKDDHNLLHIRLMQWQLIPSFAKEFKSEYSMFNTRAETFFEKKGFWPRLLETSRCLVPANNFFEWEKTEGKKTPYKFELKDRSLMTIGGVYSIWRDGEGQAFYSASMITVPANEVVGKIHTRMPFILPRESEKVWLDNRPQNLDYLKNVVKPYPADKMHSFRVSPQVNNSRNDSPELIIPVS